MRITVKIDTNECISAANCTGVAPKLFQIGREAYAELLDAKGAVQGTSYTFEATDHELELVQEAAESCPTRAIQVVEGV